MPTTAWRPPDTPLRWIGARTSHGRGVSPGPINLTSSIVAQHRSLFLSAGHRTNILNAPFEEVGIGQEHGTFRVMTPRWSPRISPRAAARSLSPASSTTTRSQRQFLQRRRTDRRPRLSPPPAAFPMSLAGAVAMSSPSPQAATRRSPSIWPPVPSASWWGSARPTSRWTWSMAGRCGRTPA